jgi:hypothetical protein
VQKDKVSVLKVNTKPNSLNGLGLDYPWQIIGNTIENDGYISSKAVKITFWDANDDSVVDNPDAFEIIVDTALTNTNRFVFFEKYTTDSYIEDYRYISNENNMFIIYKLINITKLGKI